MITDSSNFSLDKALASVIVISLMGRERETSRKASSDCTPPGHIEEREARLAVIQLLVALPCLSAPPPPPPPPYMNSQLLHALSNAAVGRKRDSYK